MHGVPRTDQKFHQLFASSIFYSEFLLICLHYIESIYTSKFMHYSQNYSQGYCHDDPLTIENIFARFDCSIRIIYYNPG